MDLPTELRRLIYAFALELPIEVPPLAISSKEWIPAYEPHPTPPILDLGILLCNKQISNETHELLYGSHICTTVINSWRTIYSHHRHLGSKKESTIYETFPKAPSWMQWIRHLQLDIHTTGKWDDKLCVMETILCISEELVKAGGEMMTLKVKIPCLCGVRYESQDHDLDLDIPETEAAFLENVMLQPLKRLRVKGTVTFIAARRLSRDEVDGYSARRHEYTVSTQCQEAGCLRYITLLDALREYMMSSTRSEGLLEQQVQWLEVRKRAMGCSRYSLRDRDVERCLKRLFGTVVGGLGAVGKEKEEEEEDEKREYGEVYGEMLELLEGVEERERMQEEFLRELRAEGLSTWDGLPRGETEFWEE
ncbi:MAG: hypothetical protein Q9186_000717 [Xanthomendoza sp. 1 TL-2023]